MNIKMMLLISGSLLCDTAGAQDRFTLKSIYGLEVGMESYSYSYVEEVNNAFFMSNKGEKAGVTANYTHLLNNENYIKGDVRYSDGKVTYSSSTGTGKVSDNMFETRLTLGNEAYYGHYLLGTHIGAGYRQLNNDLRDLGSGGYRRTSEYFYVPLGMTHRFWINPNVSRLSTTLEYDYFIKGQQTSYLSDVSATYARRFGDPVNQQKNGYGIRLSSAYEVMHWSVGLFMNYWDIGDSEKNYYIDGGMLYSVTEPKNVTKEIGMEIKYRF